MANDEEGEEEEEELMAGKEFLRLTSSIDGQSWKVGECFKGRGSMEVNLITTIDQLHSPE